MPYTFRTFDNKQAAEDYLNGAVVGSPLPAQVWGLDGKDFIVNDGAADVTTVFSATTTGALTPTEILSQIRASSSTMSCVVLRNYGYSPSQPVLVVTGTSNSVEFSAATASANYVLGFATVSTAVTEVGTASLTFVNTGYDSGPHVDILVHS